MISDSLVCLIKLTQLIVVQSVAHIGLIIRGANIHMLVFTELKNN